MEMFRHQLVAALPTGWLAKESVTVIAPDGQANVIVSSEPIDAAVDTTRYATTQGDLLRREFPGYQDLGEGPMTWLGGHDGYFRRFEWSPPDGVPVMQVQLYLVLDGRGFTATATTPSTQFERFANVIEDIILGLALDRRATRPGTWPGE